MNTHLEFCTLNNVDCDLDVFTTTRFAQFSQDRIIFFHNTSRAASYKTRAEANSERFQKKKENKNDQSSQTFVTFKEKSFIKIIEFNQRNSVFISCEEHRFSQIPKKQSYNHHFVIEIMLNFNRIKSRKRVVSFSFNVE